jgi:thiamine-monophosphate kinase
MMDDLPKRHVRLGPGPEFDRIRRAIAGGRELPQTVRVGPGDDAAVIEGGWVISTDMSVEDVHFRRAWITDEEIGFRAASAALSDLAAMAAAPTGLFASVALPTDDSVNWDALQAGIAEAADLVGAALLGGDLARSPGPLVLDMTVLGCTSWPVLRNGAEPGDEVWVTGDLGASAAAVQAWDRGKEPPKAARDAFARPEPRVKAAQCLVEHELIDALMDISDGLAGDASHMASASGAQIVLDAHAIPVAPIAIEILGPDQALEAALYGGEDYELLFVTDPGVVDVEYFQRRHGLKLTRVGRVEAGEGVLLERGGERLALERGGFDHFGGET